MRCNCYRESRLQLIPVRHLGSASLDVKHHYSKVKCGKSVSNLEEFSLLIQSTYYVM